MRRPPLPVLACLALAACQWPSAPASPAAQPARLRSPDAACVQALDTAATELTGQSVSLGPQAFADGALLWLESGNARGRDGRPLDGRKTERPLALTLVRSAAGACELHHAAAGRHRVLPAACQCEAAAARP